MTAQRDRHLTLEGQKMKNTNRLVIVTVTVFCTVALLSLWQCVANAQDAAGSVEPPLEQLPESSEITFNIRDAASINKFLEWLGLVQIVPPDTLGVMCRDKRARIDENGLLVPLYAPLGIYRRPDGAEGMLCFDKTEAVDPQVCANWNVEYVSHDLDTVTCRKGAGTRKHGA